MRFLCGVTQPCPKLQVEPLQEIARRTQRLTTAEGTTSIDGFGVPTFCLLPLSFSKMVAMLTCVWSRHIKLESVPPP